MFRLQGFRSACRGGRHARPLPASPRLPVSAPPESTSPSLRTIATPALYARPKVKKQNPRQASATPEEAFDVILETLERRLNLSIVYFPVHEPVGQYVVCDGLALVFGPSESQILREIIRPVLRKRILPKRVQREPMDAGADEVHRYWHAAAVEKDVGCKNILRLDVETLSVLCGQKDNAERLQRPLLSEFVELGRQLRRRDVLGQKRKRLLEAVTNKDEPSQLVDVHILAVARLALGQLSHDLLIGESLPLMLHAFPPVERFVARLPTFKMIVLRTF